MFAIKINIINFIFFIITVQVEALDPLPVVENNNIAITEAVIRNTVNSLFATFKIKGIKRKPQIQQYSKIHNYFVSIALKDYENLKQIASLSTVKNIDNSTQNYITQINEVLNEGDKSDHVTTNIEAFISKLRYLKEKYVSENNTDTNTTILKILEDSANSFDNVTINFTASNGTDDQSEDLLDEFWHSSGRRIFEGTRTRIKYFPFMASVHFFDQFQCAGSIIKNDLVITSASCLQIAWNNRFFRENPTFLGVRVGSDMYRTGGDFISVLEIYFHPQYSPETLAHNLAIMRLSRVLKFRRQSKNIKKIAYDKSPFPLIPTTQITVVGWGAKDRSNMIKNIHENRLSYADLTFYPLPECQDHFSKLYVTTKNFCAGFFSKGGGACNHDAGGPGIFDSKLIGVVSFGSPVCGAPDVPTVFVKLGYYVDWIESIFEQDTLTVKHDTTTWSPTPFRIPFRARTETTKRRIRPVYPIERFDDVFRSTSSNESVAEDFISSMFGGDINDSNKMNINRAVEEKTTAEWFIETTTPVTAVLDPIMQTDDRRVPKLYMPDAGTNIELPGYILPVDTQNQFNNNHVTNNKVSTEETITSQNGSNPNSKKKEKSLIQDIMSLIDKLNIDSLFDTELIQTNDNSQKIELPTNEGEHLNGLKDKVESNPSEPLVSSSSDLDDYGDDYETGDRGIDIQPESFHDLTYKTTANETDTENEDNSGVEISLF